MKYKIYKGMDSPCKIHDLLANDYFILLAVKVTCGVIVLNAVSESLKEFTLIPLVISVSLSLLTIMLLQKHFHRRGNKPKNPVSTKATTIPNIELFKNLKKTSHHEQ